MEFFIGIMDIIWDGLQRPFTLYGRTFSFENIILLLALATLACAIFEPIFKK